MMRKNFIKAAITVCSLIAFASAHAEVPISFSGQLGYASPQGSWFENADGEKMSKFGLATELDVLWHFEQLDYKLGVGLTWNSSFLFGADLSDGMDVGLYGLSLYGVKGQWRFFNSKVSPYGALSLGLSRFSMPEITVSVNGGPDQVLQEAQSAFGFGIRPEVGVELGVFFVSAGYLIPMKYSFEDSESNSAGSLQVNIGLRFSLFNRN